MVTHFKAYDAACYYNANETSKFTNSKFLINWFIKIIFFGLKSKASYLLFTCIYALKSLIQIFNTIQQILKVKIKQ